MSDRAPCVRCGLLLHTGEGRVIISFLPTELVELVQDTTSPALQARLLCALGVIDPEREKALRAELSE